MANLRIQYKKVYSRLAIVILVVITVTYLWPSRAKSIPPLPGTYLYYHDVGYRTQDHKRFGAVNHADIRFAISTDPDHGPSIQETRDSLQWLLESYMKKMTEFEAETWMAHGTLLGWWWNHRLLPWDTDLDVQMSYSTLQRLSEKWNGTRFSVEVADPASWSSLTREYLFDVNPHFSLITKDDVANHIDARWIDVKNGKYLDITAVHSPSERDSEGNTVEHELMLWCKDGHRYHEQDLFPLKDSVLETTEVKVPRDVDGVLVEEYGRRSITNKKHHWHVFNDNTKVWEPE